MRSVWDGVDDRQQARKKASVEAMARSRKCVRSRDSFRNITWHKLNTQGKTCRGYAQPVLSAISGVMDIEFELEHTAYDYRRLDSQEWLEMKKKVLLRQVRHVSTRGLVGAVAVGTLQAVRAREYYVNGQHVDLTQLKSTFSPLSWHIAFEYPLPEPDCVPTKPDDAALFPCANIMRFAEEDVLCCALEELDTIARESGKDPEKSEVGVLVDITNFTDDGRYAHLCTQTAQEDVLLRTDLYEALRYADRGVTSRAGQSTMQSTLGAMDPVHVMFNPCVTVMRGSGEDGYPFLEKPRTVAVIVQHTYPTQSLRLKREVEIREGKKVNLMMYRDRAVERAMVQRLELSMALASAKGVQRLLIMLPGGHGDHCHDTCAYLIRQSCWKFSYLFKSVTIVCPRGTRDEVRDIIMPPKAVATMSYFETLAHKAKGETFVDHIKATQEQVEAERLAAMAQDDVFMEVDLPPRINPQLTEEEAREREKSRVAAAYSARVDELAYGKAVTAARGRRRSLVGNEAQVAQDAALGVMRQWAGSSEAFGEDYQAVPSCVEAWQDALQRKILEQVEREANNKVLAGRDWVVVPPVSDKPKKRPHSARPTSAASTRPPSAAVSCYSEFEDLPEFEQLEAYDPTSMRPDQYDPFQQGMLPTRRIRPGSASAAIRRRAMEERRSKRGRPMSANPVARPPRSSPVSARPTAR